MGKNEIALKHDTFALFLKFKLALENTLEECKHIEKEGNEYNLVFSSNKKAKLKILKKNNILVFTISTDHGYSNDGRIIEIDCKLDGYEKILMYQFTTCPNFKPEQEPYEYPQFPQEINEKTYDAWSYPLHLNTIENLPYHLKVSKILFKLKKDYVFLLPITYGPGRTFITYFTTKNSFCIVHNAYAPTEWSSLTLFTIGFDKDPYNLVEKCFDVSFKVINKLQVLRKYKHYPKVFEYLGWCSWNAYWRDITYEKIIYAAKKFATLKLPIKFILIDDGWMEERNSMLISFKPNSKKFPKGFKELVKELKAMGYYFVGLWHTLNGYWKGIDPNGDIARTLNKYLINGPYGKLPNPEYAFQFYNEWYHYLCSCGFDFVKVDNQSCIGYHYGERLAINEVGTKLHEGLEGAAYVNKLDILNCMPHQPENYYNWYRSSIARCCIDYVVPHRKSRDKLHLYFNSYNALWLSQLVWPDWDMFQTHDPWALQQAVARAVSGGPIYITDEPDKVNDNLVRKLALPDGTILRPDVPALPTEDCLFKDPYNEPYPLKLFTKVTVNGVGEYGILAVFNITKKDNTLKVVLSPKDAKVNF